ncbi:hypothetical protein CBR_g78241 [Chara braunii]|uniref:Pyrrolo-quinoline quinone repeat domain-containing protein n=1 Tax=Chara braunii TaxID=69332 RepID=A0A388JKL1_CHABU|nr:hypothetical protein CBR_g78241 [Chara braunii]|eukprot:GBG44754.1 hypothetical protein CBR_g78241 [Chara braunii]
MKGMAKSISDYLFVASHGHVLALDRERGETVWKVRLGNTGWRRWYVVSLFPVETESLLICGCHGKIIALSMNVGQEIWRNRLPKLGYGDIAIHMPNQPCPSRSVLSVGVASGREYGRLAYYGSRHSFSEDVLMQRPLTAISSTASTLSTPPTIKEDGAGVGSTLPGLSDLVIVGTYGHVVAIDIANGGKTVWSYSLPWTGYGVVNTLLEGGKLFVGCGGRVFALDPLSGKEIWRNALPGLRRGFVTMATSTSWTGDVVPPFSLLLLNTTASYSGARPQGDASRVGRGAGRGGVGVSTPSTGSPAAAK